MIRKIETLIVGGGQAGLSVSYFLSQNGREHVILERSAQPANTWRNDRWDSFTLLTPNWSFRIPGAAYSGSNPEGFLQRAEVVSILPQYGINYNLPLQFNTTVESVEYRGSCYDIETDSGPWQAQNVVVATGLFQTPKILPFHTKIPANIYQVPSGQYRNPAQLPPGAVLVVGSGQSGCQIAEELYGAGRKVYLCLGSAGRAPRRYRGRDVYDWLNQAGFFDRSPELLPSPQARFSANPHISGKNGGHTLNLHQFARDGVTLLGRLVGIEDGRALLASDRDENLRKADQLEANLVKLIDGYIDRNHIDAPHEILDVLTDGFNTPEILSLNLNDAGITSVIWALGYTFDFSLVKAPVFDEVGFPITHNCAAAIPGLYFIGMPWLVSQKSGLFLGVGEDAEKISTQIQARASKGNRKEMIT